MTTRKYGVDVSVYQPTNMKKYHEIGASFAIVKLTEGTYYINPKAQDQVTSSRNNHLYTHAYHFANFGNSVDKAKKEASYFINFAKKVDISKKRILWLDWESSSSNSVAGSKASNTAAILAFMNEIKKAGWKPGFYSGSNLLRNAINTSEITKNFGTCLWIASYPIMTPVSTANFNYFPSMDGVAIWQFTQNWNGLNVDGNVALVDLNKESD